MSAKNDSWPFFFSLSFSFFSFCFFRHHTSSFSSAVYFFLFKFCLLCWATKEQDTPLPFPVFLHTPPPQLPLFSCPINFVTTNPSFLKDIYHGSRLLEHNKETNKPKKKKTNKILYQKSSCLA